MPAKTEIKPKFVVVRLNETQHWSDDIKAQVKAIYAHYLFDENSHTHCCEITPSYWLRWVGFDIEMEEAGADVPEKLYSTVEDSFHAIDNDCYYHCRVIDKIDGENKKVFMEGSDLDPWGEDYGYDNVFDEVVTSYYENPVF